MKLKLNNSKIKDINLIKLIQKLSTSHLFKETNQRSKSY